MYKSHFIVDESSRGDVLFYDHDENDLVEGYTDKSMWNGWINVCFSRDQISRILDASPFDYRFFKKHGLPCLRIYFTDREEEIESSPLPTDDGDILEGYYLENVQFVEVNHPK